MSEELLDEYWTEAELARLLEKAPRTVGDRYTKRINNPLPYLKLGNRKLFHKDTTREWLRSLERKPNPQREPRKVRHGGGA